MMAKWKKYPTEKMLNQFADAFYDEDYKKMSDMLGKKITSQSQAEAELFQYKLKKMKKKVV
jgi:hypothetical protein